VRYFSLRDLDWPLVIIALLISALGVVQIYSATHDTPWQSAWWKQIIFIGVGLVIMWIMASIDYHSLMAKAPIMYGVSLVLLIVVLVVGSKIFGSRRWIPIFGFTFQVSEFVKLVLILLVARFLTELRTEILDGRELAKLGALVMIPMLLVQRQPDLGTALTFLPILGIGIYLAGLRKEYLLIIVLLAGLAPVVGWRFLHDYQKTRLVSFLNPESDPRGAGYQQIQSLIAVGAGGMWGQGVAKGVADAIAVPAGGSDRLHLFGVCRGAWVRGGYSRSGSLFCFSYADGTECPDSSGPRRNVYLHGCGCTICLSLVGEYRYGSRKDARSRHPAAADECGRLEYVIDVFNVGTGE
jgi:cell division protein FtsW (lipid II flippase)